MSSNAFTAKPFRLHCMRAFFPISLATAPRLVWSDMTLDRASGSPCRLAASDVTDKGDSVLLLLRLGWGLRSLTVSFHSGALFWTWSLAALLQRPVRVSLVLGFL